MSALLLKRADFNLIRCLVTRDLKARYKVSVLGFFWSLLRPLFLIAIFTLVFSHFFRFEMSYKDLPYSVFLIIGMLPWVFFSESVGEATTCLVANANLIRKVYLPRIVFPISAVLSKLVNFLLALVVLLPFVFLFGKVTPTWSLLAFPLLIIVETIFALGLAFFFAIGNVYFRDLTILVEVILMGWFYLTPVFYPLHYVWNELASYPAIRWLYMANPMASLTYAYRRVLLHGVPQSETLPLPISDERAMFFVLVCVAVSLLIFISGAWVFNRFQKSLEDYL